MNWELQLNVQDVRNMLLELEKRVHNLSHSHGG